MARAGRSTRTQRGMAAGVVSAHALVVAALVASAVLVLGPGSARRITRLSAHPSGPNRGTMRASRRGAAPSPPMATVSAVRELVQQAATLMRSGVPPWQVWSGLTEVADAAGPVAGRAARIAAVGGDAASVLREGVAASSAQRSFSAPRSDPGGQALQGLAAAWEVADRSGAPLADVLDRYADGLLAQEEAADARAVALAGPRATSRVLVVLPVAGIGLGVLIGADPITVLTQTAIGRWCAVLGTALAALGWWWSQRLVQLASRQ